MRRNLPLIVSGIVLAGLALAASQKAIHTIFVQGITIGSSGTKIDDSYAASGSTLLYDFPSISANTCTDTYALTVTGAALWDACVVGAPPTLSSNMSFTCYVSAADTVKVRACNPTVGAIDAADAGYSVRVFDP